MNEVWTLVMAPFGFGGKCLALNLPATSNNVGRGECIHVSGIGTWHRYCGIKLMDKPLLGIHPWRVYNVQVRPAPVKSFGDDHGRLLQIAAIR